VLGGLSRVLSDRYGGCGAVGRGLAQLVVVDSNFVCSVDRRGGVVVAPPVAERVGAQAERSVAIIRGSRVVTDPFPSGVAESMKVALVTDSNAQLPVMLIDQYEIKVVPLGIVIDGALYQEGVDLGVDEFYARLRAGAQVTTSAPPPGAFVDAYEKVAAGGAQAILSVHVGAALSGTLGSARLATQSSPVPVELVDSGTASFALGCCVWEAAEMVAKGATLAEAARAARSVADRIGNVFIVGGLDLPRRGGRLADDVKDAPGVPVLALERDTMRKVADAHDGDAALEIMAQYVRARVHGRARVGVGDAQVPELAARLADTISDPPGGVEVIRYTVGPSVGCHTGPGTVGAVFYER
jgi:DegV family protein with EDD domain